MKRLIVFSVMAVFVTAGCGSNDDDSSDSTAEPASGTSDQSPPDQVVDPCTLLSDAELSSLGLILERKRAVSELDAEGCGWSGEVFGLSVTVNPESISGYLSRRDDPNFNFMNEIEVGGRPAIEFNVSTDQQCAVRVDAGSGSIGVNVQDSSGLDEPRDECADARRVMELVATKLP